MAIRKVNKEDVAGVLPTIGDDVDTDSWKTIESEILKLVEGQKLVGVLTRIEDNAAAPILHFATSKGEVRMWASAKLEEIFNKTYIGHTFEVIFLGTIALKGGHKMNTFSVRMKPDDTLDLPVQNTEEEIEIIREQREAKKKAKKTKKQPKKKAKKKGK